MDDRLDELLGEWEDRRAAGRPATPEELCPNDPALRAALVGLIDRLKRVEARAAAAPDSESPAAPPPKVPERIGRYEVRRPLVEGGWGVVYEGWDPSSLKRPVAIKVLRPARLPAAARFHQDCEVLARLDHPNILQVYDSGVHDGLPYLVMEFVPGGDLTRTQERLTEAGPRAVVPLVEKIARAVHYAHEQGVLHRDLKPANVLLDKAGEPLVTDFGLAKLFTTDPAVDSHPGGSPPADPASATDPPSARLTVSGARAGGTPPYMAPEQYDERFGEVGPATDVWALGVILYELLAGRRPFGGTEFPDYYKQVTGDPAPPLKGFGRPLAAVVARCLEKDPARRYQTAGEVADALAGIAARRRARRRAGWAVLYAACLALGTALAAAVMWPRPETAEKAYERGVAPHLAAIAAGQSVNLIKSGGRPTPHLVRTTGGGVVVTPTPAGITIDSARMAVVELLPRVPAGNYTVTARLRHDSRHHNAVYAGVGLVTSGFHHDGPGGRQHLIQHSSSSTGLLKDAIPTGVYSFWFLELPDGSTRPQSYLIQNSADQLGVQAAEPTATWVTVVVTVTDGEAGSCTVFHSDGRKTKPLRCPEEVYPAHVGYVVLGQPEAAGVPFPEQTPRTVGIWVYGGLCTVEQVTVAPH
ncbi:MAG: serine/threonine protein kinase [Gemmataceae bacterium]|nr:serine/threonine protein kinase [Gemmataceae bacterium]